MVLVFLLVGFCLFIILIGLLTLKLILPKSPKKFSENLKQKHVLITGGSKGIGRALAVEVVKKGGHVTILARNLDQLKEAEGELEQLKVWQQQKISIIPVDLTENYEKIEEKILKNLPPNLPVDILINNTGGCVDGEFEKLKILDFEQQMRLNFLSAVHVTRIFVGQLKKRAQETDEGCRIVFLSSVAGQFGLFGYTAYSPSKFALRGLAESLQMELKPYNVWVTVAYPPNTDTEGYALEIQHSPTETKLISGQGGLFQPHLVARQLLDDASRGHFCSSFGLDGWLVANLCVGMSPETNLGKIVQQTLFMGLFRFVSLFYLASFYSIVQRCAKKKRQ